MTASATFPCASCGNVAATVTLVEPSQAATGSTGSAAEPSDPSVVPRTVLPDLPEIAIAGIAGVMSIAPVPQDAVAAALETGDPAALFAINYEYAPFWCPRCTLSYCGDHYRSWMTFDEGFYDATYGVCPEGHERMLDD